jgi:hypothetical protein
MVSRFLRIKGYVLVAYSIVKKMLRQNKKTFSVDSKNYFTKTENGTIFKEKIYHRGIFLYPI